MITLPKLIQEIMDRDDFVSFRPELEQQMLDIANETSTKLYFDVDRSGGHRQMMQWVWVSLEEQEVKA